MRAVVVVSVDFGQLFAIAEVARHDPRSQHVRVQLRSEDGDATARYALLCEFPKKFGPKIIIRLDDCCSVMNCY